jgi:predicted DNA-binding transcriptional regulator AlpA
MKDGTALPGWPLILRRELAAAYLGMSVSTFDAGVKDGTLPQPLPTYGTLRAWHRGDLEAWVEARRALTAGAPSNPWDGP